MRLDQASGGLPLAAAQLTVQQKAPAGPAGACLWKSWRLKSALAIPSDGLHRTAGQGLLAEIALLVAFGLLEDI